ncbi:hypothetical protein GWI33_019864 [Rhynchophorus ferrugineus]|uniref:Platelet-derived growth factor (PDGF) family profile domain-containing protein n=1 Tax=Rhynchophorus ferrugineus TaxID=354439 RepID=A0A834M3V1_RHYFE|nr:hypothetical protein GWI33_019864 [Rhynchophorus ferrugineus]
MYSSLRLVVCALMMTRAWGKHLSNDVVLDEVSSLPCEMSQSRAFAVHRLTGDIFTYSPPFIVLYRCRGSDCCKDQNQSCRPNSREKVTMSIKFDNESKFDLVNVSATNHTGCICKETIKRRPKKKDLEYHALDLIA